MAEQEETLVQIKEIDRHDERVMKGLEEAPLYKKQGEIKADFAKGGEVVVTKLADGTSETTNTAQPGDVIITNPGGEQYIIDSVKFGKRYESKEGEEGVFTARGYCKAIDNPFGSQVTMLAEWGEMQNGGIDCKIADTYEPEAEKLGGEPYIIGLAEFNQTYKPAPAASDPASPSSQ